MSNADQPAYPTSSDTDPVCDGLTKRELIAAMAMQGLIAQTPVAVSATELARQAVICADALLVELSKTKETT